MDLSEASLEEIAENLSMSEIQVLSLIKGDDHFLNLREKIEAQVPEVTELIAQYTKNQYVQQTVEVMPGLDVTFRTMPPETMDESLNFAAKHRGESQDTVARILSRRRLSYAVIDVNGEPLGAVPLDGSYFDMIRADKDKFKKQMTEYADSVYDYLSYYGLTDKISEVFGVWENVIYNRINGIDDLSGTLKNSTRGSAKGQ